MASGFSLKDQLFNAEKVAYLAGLFAAADPQFDAARFQSAVMARLLDLELKERIAWIAACLQKDLPADLIGAAAVMRAALPPPLDPTRQDDDFGDFIFAPLGEVVVSMGLESEPELALDMLCDVTQRFSMEWAVRPFLNQWQELTLARMADWAKHDNYHVRRLVSEGTRPKLPWGQGVSLSVEAPLPLLDELHSDRTRYVTRSVANHLNDITKSDPDLVLDRLACWRAAGAQEPKELDWMAGHALRSLIKAGEPRAMREVGYDPDAPITLVKLEMPKQAEMGGKLPIEMTLSATAAAGAMVDYVFWRLKSDGTHARSVRKVKQVRLAAGQPQTLSKTHILKADATTYRLLPGRHRIDVQVNGRILGGADFELCGP
ncbi:MAG: hypothetical protein AAFR45_06815 [Pseudomonadota bacterium]